MKIIILAILLSTTVYLPFLGSADPLAPEPRPTRQVRPTRTPTSTLTPTSPIDTPTATLTATQTPQPPVTPTFTPAPTDTPPPPADTPTAVPTNTPPPAGPATRRINAPNLPSGAEFDQAAVAWFGQVDSTSNYADIRVFYRSNGLRVHLNIFDRRLWFDSSPSSADLEAWDTATIYLDTGSGGGQPSATSHRLVAQLSNGSNRSAYQTAYTGNGSGWVAAPTAFTTNAGWRGAGLNNNAEARGWSVVYVVPFSSLGLGGPPPANAVWRMAVVLNDRDDAGGAPIAARTWPEGVNGQQPSSWGELSFGIPTYSAPPSTGGGTTTVRHGLDGATVVDGHAGGETTCAEDIDPNFFQGFGSANYAGADQINIQNQWDVADWPCYSKFYISFPVNGIPPGKVIVNATLTMHLFGNSGEGWVANPPRSLIQVLAVRDEWNEGTLTWNNAPLAVENIASTWVEPLTGPLVWPGVPYTWDVSRALAAAYAQSQPLRLALYSADLPMHTGKYFSSSDTGDWNAAGRPTLLVTWGEAVQ